MKGLDSEGLRADPQDFQNNAAIRKVPLTAYHQMPLVEYNHEVDL